MNILAVDTGSDGAVILLNPEGEPIAVRVLIGTKTGKYWQRLIDFIESAKNCGEFEAVVEKVWGMPGQKSASSITKNYGMVLGILRAHGIEPVEVVPLSWQKPFIKPREKTSWHKEETDEERSARLNANRAERKQELIDAAASIYGRKVDHSGIADALLIGRWRWMVLTKQIEGPKPKSKKKRKRKNNKGVKK